MKNILSTLLLSLTLFGCASVDRSNYSDGLNMLEGLQLARTQDLIELKETAHKNKLTQVKSTGGSMIDLAFGSGLVGSTSFFLESGNWMSTGNFSNGASLATFVLDSLSGKGMKYHKWTYTYFFHMSAECDDRDCANSTLSNFNDKLNALYIKEAREVKGITNYLEKPFFSPSNFFAKYVTGGATYTSAKSGKVKEHKLFSVWDLDERDDYKNETVWGNETWADYQDKFNLGFGYKRDTELLIEATKGNQSLVVFRGVDMQGLVKKQPCFGGFFIRNGQIINIPELGCMAKAQAKS